MRKTIDMKSIIAILILDFTALKMMFLPSLCTGNVGRLSFAVVFLVLLIEVGLVAGFLLLAKKTDMTFFELLESLFGKVIAKIIVAIYCIYFLITTFSVCQSLFTYLSAHLYNKYSWIVYTISIVLMVMLVSATDLKGMVRLVQFFIPFIAVCVFITMLLGALNCDFSNILPIDVEDVSSGIKMFDYSFWFGDALIVFLFFGKIDKQQSIKPVIISLIILSAILSFFFFVFYCIYEGHTVNNQEAITDILQVLPQNSDIGSVDWVITVVWQLALLVYICLYAYVTRIFFEHTFSFSNAKISLPIILALVFGGLIAINFDMTKLLTILTNYMKYYSVTVQYVIPITILLFSVRIRRKDEKAVQK